MISETELKNYYKSILDRRGMKVDMDRFKSDSIVSDGIKLNLDMIEVGRDKPSVVFVPGTSAYALLYAEFLGALADSGYNAIGLDPRGHGRSEGRRGSYTLPELVRDTLAAVDYAKSKFNANVAVAGSSQGGIVAFYLAAGDAPVKGVVCHNVADLGDPDSVRLTRTPAMGKIMKPLLALFASVAPELPIPISLYLDLAAEEMRGFGNAKNFLEQDPLALSSIRLKGLASLANEKLPKPVEKISVPVQILHAGKDNIFPTDYIENIYNKLTCKKSLKIYPGLPHLILTEHVGTVMPDVVGWLKEIFR